MADLTEVDAHLSPLPLKILFFDVESAPMLCYAFDLKVDYIGPHMIVEPPFLLTWSAKWADDDKILSDRLTGKEAKAQDDARLAESLASLIRQADVVVAHNGDRFDLPKLNTRLVTHQLDPVGDVKSIDTLKKARQAFKFPSNRLGELAKSLGLEVKTATDFSLWKRARAGDVPALKEMDAYCQQDVVVLESVFEALRPHVKGLPRLVDAGQFGQRVCPSCGSSDLDPDGVHRTNANSYARFRCGKCGRHCRSFRQSSAAKLETRPL